MGQADAEIADGLQDVGFGQVITVAELKLAGGGAGDVESAGGVVDEEVVGVDEFAAGGVDGDVADG